MQKPLQPQLGKIQPHPLQRSLLFELIVERYVRGHPQFEPNDRLPLPERKGLGCHEAALSAEKLGAAPLSCVPIAAARRPLEQPPHILGIKGMMHFALAQLSGKSLRRETMLHCRKASGSAISSSLGFKLDFPKDRSLPLGND